MRSFQILYGGSSAHRGSRALFRVERSISKIPGVNRDHDRGRRIHLLRFSFYIEEKKYVQVYTRIYMRTVYV